MVESTVLNQLKSIPALLASKKQSTRREGIELLSSVARNEQDLPSNIVKGIAKLSISVAGQCVERSLQHCSRQLLANVATTQRGLPFLAPGFSHIAKPHSQLSNTSVSTSRYYLPYLEAVAEAWIAVIRHNRRCKKRLNFHNNAEEITLNNHDISQDSSTANNTEIVIDVIDAQKHAEALCIFFSLSAASGHKHLTKRAVNSIAALWQNTDSLAIFCKELSSDDAGIHHLVTGGHLLKFLRENKIAVPDQQLKLSLLQTYIKLLFQTKVKPSQLCLKGCRALLREVSHSELSSIILPAVSKSLLRNPEAVLTALANMTTGLNLDLSQYLPALVKLLQAPLHHKEDGIRSDTVQVCGHLVRRCSDSAAVTAFLTAIFDVYFGSDGKLTVTTHKVSVLQAVEACSQHNVSFNGSGAVLEKMVAQWTKVVEAESHEGSLLQAMAALYAWLNRAPAVNTTALHRPQLLTDNLQKHIVLKNWTTCVRAAYFRCLCGISNSSNAAEIANTVIKPTIKTMEKALTQHTQVSQLVEALSACSFLLSLSAADCSVESQLSTVWSSALDFNKAFFTSDKFLASAPPEGLMELCSIIEILLLHHHNRIADYEPVLLRCLVTCLCWRQTEAAAAAANNNNIGGVIVPSERLANPSAAVRQKARAVLRKLLSSNGGPALALSVLQSFSAYLVSVKLESVNGVTPSSAYDAYSGGEALTSTQCTSFSSSEAYMSSAVSPAGVQHALSVLAQCVQRQQLSNRISLAVAALPVTCSPLVEYERRGLWKLFFTELNLTSALIIKHQKAVLVDLMTKNYTHSVTNAKVVSELCRVCGFELYGEVISYLVNRLDDPRLLEITEEEYIIYNTPDGKLYHQHLVDEAFEMNVDTKHVKKTTKVYSHKEQVMMLEEKKAEIERKRREGKLDLTPKQKEVMKVQLEKEAQIRKRVSSVLDGVDHHVSLLCACIEGDDGALGPSLTSLVPLLVRYFKSPVVGQTYVRFFVQLRRAVIPAEHMVFGELVARTTVRVLGAQSRYLPPDWNQEHYADAALRALTIMHEITVPASSDLLNEDEEKFFCAPAFVFCFPLLEWLLSNLHEVAYDDDSDVDEGRGGGGGDSDEENNGEEKDVNERESVRIACLGLQVLSEHMCMRGSGDISDGRDLYHPRLLPLQQLITLVIRVIGNSSGRTHSMACGVLCEVCSCGSGASGCHKASKLEITTLLDTLTAPSASVRDAVLRGLDVLSACLPEERERADWLQVCHRLWVAKHDVQPEVKEQADLLWDKIKMQVHDSICEPVRKDLLQPVSAVRQAAAVALAMLLTDRRNLIKKTITALIATYKEKTKMTPAKRDQYDRVVEDSIDHWEGRSGVALALTQLAPIVELNQVVQLVNFFVPEALGDRNNEVAANMLEAATMLINYHGKDTVNSLLPIFEKCLKSAPNHASFDKVRQSVVILMGTLAKHLEPTNPKIKPIVAKLVEALSTPSQPVQEAVASCLHPLVPAIKDDCPRLVAKLLTVLLESDKYGERKGAAYGLASLVKGMGILALKQLEIITKLTSAIQDKKNYKFREGALFGLEQLCNMLGKLFEPYIVHILPHLLLCFGDQNAHVRQAAKDTARAVMSKLSAHGVKLVLPSLLTALDEDSWRTKRGSVELLGNMAFCAPKQLSSCLPSVVPRLIEVLSDSHQKVQQAGAQALRLIGSVIKNPEIQAIVPVLLAALRNPGRSTSQCLQTLLHTKFVHFIDAPSLALIMPVVERAFEDRSTETRKMAAQIIGNMYSLTDQKDLTPYLPAIIPGLKASLLDPVPKVRSVSARALGAMVRGMGESSFEDLLPWLMQTLTSESSPVDRSGAAQGLAEVVGGLGPEKLHLLMPDIVATAERSDIAPHVKDGYIMMFIFLPSVFQKEFTPYIGQIIPPILNALADETEFVRDTALKAGQRIVTLYAETAIELLLPELEAGLFHDNWRIRFSSIQLLGDLLYRISGVSGKMTTDTANEDDNFGTEQSQKAIMLSLGVDRRNRVLAGLYMGRSDVALLVRQAALHVWKVVVTNTPKTLKEILPTLFTLLLGCLASTSYDKRQVAARTLGELVRKLGERVLPEIMPILEVGLESEDPDHRQGVCIGLSEIMASTSKDMVLCFTDNLVPTVRRALCDPLPAVREAAAKTFDALHGTIGQKALDETLPPLLALLKTSEGEKTEEEKKQAEYALDGLKQIMAIKSKVVLPYLVPQLIAPPVNTEALCILASVAGDSLTKHLDKILPALVYALSVHWGDGPSPQPQYEVALVHSHGVILAVSDPLGINIILDELLRFTKNKDVGYVRAAVSLLVAFCSNTRADYSDHVVQLLRGLLQLFTSKDMATLQAAWAALNAVTKSLDASDQRTLVADVRQAVKFAASDLKPGQLMPGFCLPKGIQPILPIYREAILNGEPELKEAASIALTEVIQITSSDSLKLSVIHVTGPLIRILGDRFAPSVKVAVLNTIGLLLEKTGVMLKPFLPQLQTTFIKAIHDPHRGVRLRSGYAMSHLVSIHLKPDPMFIELQNAVRAEEDVTVRETLIFCVRQVFTVAGGKVPEAVRKNIVSSLAVYLECDHDATRIVAAGAIASILPHMPDQELKAVLNSYFLECNRSADFSVKHGRISALFSALNICPATLFKATSEQKVVQFIQASMTSEHVPVLQSAAVAVGYFMLHKIMTGSAPPHELMQPFAKLINNMNNDVKQSMCRSVQFVCESLPKKIGAGTQLNMVTAKALVPALVNGTKEKNQVVKSAAEMALIAMLMMKAGDNGAQKVVSALEGGIKDALTDCISRNLRRAVYYPVTEPEMDSTLLS